MAIFSNKKAPPCKICGYNGSDYVYKVKDGKRPILYYACPFCWFRVEYGKKSLEVMQKLGLKLNNETRTIESIENDNKENTNKEENRSTTGTEANNSTSGNTGEERGGSWNPFG